MKLRHGMEEFQIKMGRWHAFKRRRSGFARSVTVGKLRMCATGYCSALHGIT